MSFDHIEYSARLEGSVYLAAAEASQRTLEVVCERQDEGYPSSVDPPFTIFIQSSAKPRSTENQSLRSVCLGRLEDRVDVRAAQGLAEVVSAAAERSPPRITHFIRR